MMNWNQPWEEEIEEPSEWDQHITKIAALRASPGIVSIVSHNVPEEMAEKFRGYMLSAKCGRPEEILFYGCGMIIESGTQPTGTGTSNSQYLSTILAPASLFKHYPTLDTHPDIDVFASTGLSYKAQLLAYDFHYNLATISIISDSPLPTVTLKHIDDTPNNTSTSTSVKDPPKTQFISVWRQHIHPYRLTLGSGSFSSSCPWGLSCNELYQINELTYVERDGGPVLNPIGQVIGFIFSNTSFLPSNIVSRWWNHYKSSGGFRRPFVGMKVANLHDTDLIIQKKFSIIFPEISAALVVTKVKKDSPARRSEIRTNDVILKLDDKVVRSKLEFYETIWEKVGKTVTVNVLRATETIWEKVGKTVPVNVVRATDFEELNLSLVIEETPSNKFNQWPHPNITKVELDRTPKLKPMTKPFVRPCRV